MTLRRKETNICDNNTKKVSTAKVNKYPSCSYLLLTRCLFDMNKKYIITIELKAV